MIKNIPFLLFVVLAYFGCVYLSAMEMTTELVSILLPSNSSWDLTLGDLLVAFGLFILYFELLKATRSNVTAVLDHMLSMILFVVCLLLFILSPVAGTGTFFLITLMSLIDVVAGFTVSLQTARRDMSIGTGQS